MFIINPYIFDTGGGPDPGYVYLVDQDSEQLIDQDGEYLQEPE